MLQFDNEDSGKYEVSPNIVVTRGFFKGTLKRKTIFLVLLNYPLTTPLKAQPLPVNQFPHQLTVTSSIDFESTC